MLLNGGPQFEKNPSISFLINCASEEDVQHYWDKLSEGGMAINGVGFLSMEQEIRMD